MIALVIVVEGVLIGSLSHVTWLPLAMSIQFF